MVKQTTDILSGNIIENETRLTLRQLCDSCAVRAEYIIELVDEGLIEPSGVEKSHWCFSGVTIKRVQKAKRLQRDLGVNLAGAALAVDLIDEIEYLRAKLKNI
ncbi:MAG: chaperone modulator CbpM [Gammaproteobacteria bacterium]|nr:chaperone modulator CbpM [Gammaproteobacteria bacterium]